jgi:hypothetical protein
MPSERIGLQQAMARESIVGFYSSIAHVFQNIARVSDDLEKGVDWLLETRFPSVAHGTDMMDRF